MHGATARAESPKLVLQDQILKKRYFNLFD